MQDGFISTLKRGITPEDEEIFERVNEKILENVKLFGSEEK